MEGFKEYEFFATDEEEIPDPVESSSASDLSVMRDLLASLARERDALRALEAERNALYMAAVDTEEYRRYQEAEETLREAKAVVVDRERNLRLVVERHWEITENKKPVSGLSVRVTNVARFDPAVARDWCANNAPALLVLDEKAFTKAELPGAPLEWEQRPQGMIAKDLSEYLQ